MKTPKEYDVLHIKSDGNKHHIAYLTAYHINDVEKSNPVIADEVYFAVATLIRECIEKGYCSQPVGFLSGVYDAYKKMFEQTETTNKGE